MAIKIDTNNLNKLRDKLDKIGKFAYPVAVRNTLNNAAFEAKSIVPKEAAGLFVTRNKGLFKAFVQADKATGKDVDLMSSAVGLRNNSKNQLVEDLSQQEIGGTVQNRSLIPMNPARTGSSSAKLVRKVNYLSNINIPKSKKKGTGTGFVMIKKNSHSGTVFATKKGKKNKLVPLYSYKKNRKANLKRRAFIQPSAIKASKEIPRFYVEAAERLINKIIQR